MGGVRDGSPIDVAFRVTGVEPEAVGEAVRRVVDVGLRVLGAAPAASGRHASWSCAVAPSS